MPIDLAQPRIFAFTVGQRSFTMTLKQITEAMWLKYFAGVISTQELVDGDVASSYDASGARLELLESALTDATGYTHDSITAIDGWQSKLPIAHRIAAAELLTAVTRVPNNPDDFPSLGNEAVKLSATWTAVDGRMQEVSGLIHHFRSPMADHQKRYSRAMSRSVVLGGSRNGQTRWVGAQPELIKIYDELILEVEGYVVAGAVTLDSELIKSQMDAYHKVAAATALFAPLEVATA